MSNEPIVGAAIYRKLIAVYKDVKYIQKDKRNTFHGYNYASEAAIKDRLHEAFAEHGLVLLPPEMVSIHDAEQSTKKGDRETVTTIQIRFGIADMDSGESVSGTVYGRGVDSSDKGVYKAITGALKYFLTTTFLIPTGDDPEEEQAGSRDAQAKVLEKKLVNGGMAAAEAKNAADDFKQKADPPQTEAKPKAHGVITKAQAQRLFTIATKAGLSTSKVKEIVGAYGYESTKEIPVGDYDKICGEIELYRHGVSEADLPKEPARAE